MLQLLKSTGKIKSLFYKILAINVLLFLGLLNATAATFVVDNNTDIDNALGYTVSDGSNSLRKCMRIANASPGADVINFNIPVGPFMITLGGPDLPAITQQLTINGLTQPSASAGNLLIEINATGRGNGLTYDAGSANSILMGVAINNSNRGVYIINTSAITIQACNIGTDVTGTIARPCNWNGIQIDNSPDVVIGGNGGVATRNIISGNNEVGLRIDNSLRALINGNYIGVNANGNTILGNNWYGIQLAGACHNSVIGNGLAGGGNVISGHGRDGINVNNSTNLTIKGNIVGLGVDGTTLIPNSQSGIIIGGGSTAAQIGGSTILERNIVSGNLEFGIRFNSSINGVVQGNTIGTDITGTVDLGNGLIGVAAYGASNSLTIGGAVAGQGNLVSGNNAHGIYIESSLTPSMFGNIVGLNATGTAVIANNQNGITIVSNSNGAIIGGSALTQRNIVSGNLNAGIYITQSTSPSLYGNFIGTDITGTLDFGNVQTGVVINNLSNNPIIGGAILGEGNLISGNNGTGLNIDNCTAPIIKGNIIGLSAGANALLSNNLNGILMQNSPNPIIGGGLSLLDRNIVSGNNESGMLIIASISPLIRGNIVGTDITGLIDFGNLQNGIQLVTTCSDPIIGGATAGQGNLLAGNGGSGLTIDNCLRPIIKGNIIGMGSDGTTIVANNGAGISIFTGCNNAVIGGTTVAEKNLVSGNGQIGIHVNGSTSPTIYGNYVGTDITGLLDRGNGQTGILINNGSTNALIGSAALGTGNLISGNTERGLFILNSANASIKANIIGLGIDGTTAIGNTQGGITNENSASPVIGGTTVPERNLIASNGGSGITIFNSTNALIKANYIGVDVTGMLPRGNLNAGIMIQASSNFALIGGPSLTEGNIISNHSWAGILVDNSTDVVVKSCVIGLASDYTTAAPNLQGGIGAYVNSHRLTVGGILVTERNYIASNTGNGISVNTANDVIVVNNYVGVEVTGLLSRPNTGNGVNLERCVRAIVGGTAANARNVISANGANGLRIVNSSTDAIVKANYIGVGADGSTSLGNWDNGIYMGDSSNQAIIGGPTAIERNVLSANGRSGVGDGFRSEASSRHLVRGNYCGVDASGTAILGNAWAGISINESPNCIVGGTGAFDGNICSGNLNEGVYFRNATYTTFIGNYVGTDKTGTLQLGNEDYGINIRAVSNNNKIGGSAAEANIIAYNKNITAPGPGVFVEGASQFNTITYNKIYCNAGLGIDLNGIANESIPKPIILTSTTNDITGTASIDGDIIHVYINNTTGTGCDCEGEVFIGTAVVIGGAWALNHGLTLTTAQASTLTSTETTALGSTSEFADCITPLPVSLFSFTVKKSNNQASLLEWKTVSEKNNDYFIIERSSDGINFEYIGTVDGAGSSNNLLSYSFVDENPYLGVNYYRLKQVDFNGQSEYSVIRIVDFDETSLALVSNGTDYYIALNSKETIQVSYVIYSSDGKEVRTTNLVMGGNSNKSALDLTGLASSVYYIKINAGENYIADKLLVK